MFRTTLPLNISDWKINYQDGLMSLGSCFSENIGHKLAEAFFQVEVNPFGVLYNPASIKSSLEILMRQSRFSETDLFRQGSLWKSFSHSSLFAGQDKNIVLQNINQRINLASERLRKARVLLLTFGTSWIYTLNTTGEVVANCHKLPAQDFGRRRMSVNEIVDIYRPLIEQLKELNPHLEIIMTVSPIRHWKDGAHANNLNKSILLLAIEELQTHFSFVHYFPAYEIQLDDLRDYRFYNADMLHPSGEAVDYIWKYFGETYFSKETNELRRKLENIHTQLAHRPLFPDSDEYKLFSEQLKHQIETLKTEYPFLNDRLP